MTLKEEIAEILGQVGYAGHKAGAEPDKEHLMEQAQIILPKAIDQILSALKKRLPEGIPALKLLQGSTLKETNHQIKGFNQAIEQMEGVIDE